MAAVSAVPSICATAPAVLAGREAGLPIKPLITRIGQHYGADGDHQVVERRWRAFASLCVFWPVVGLLATARSLCRYFVYRYLIFETIHLGNQCYA